jgi:hypothetical protein
MLRQENLFTSTFLVLSCCLGMEDVVDPRCNQAITISSSQPGCVTFKADDSSTWVNTDFVFGFKVWRDNLKASLHVQPPLAAEDLEVAAQGLQDLRGTFCLAISPPGRGPGSMASMCFANAGLQFRHVLVGGIEGPV